MPLGALDRTRCSLRHWTELRSAIFGKTSFKSPHLSSRRAVPVWLPPHGSMPCDVLHPPCTYHIPPSTVVPSCFHRRMLHAPPPSAMSMTAARSERMSARAWPGEVCCMGRYEEREFPLFFPLGKDVERHVSRGHQEQSNVPKNRHARGRVSQSRGAGSQWRAPRHRARHRGRHRGPKETTWCTSG